MLDYILAADLFVMTLLLAHLSWHCMKWRNELPIISESISCKTADIVEIMNEGGAILTDIADLLESSPASPPQNGSPPIDFPSMILNGLMSKMAMPSNDGPQENTVGEIHEEELNPPPE